MSFSFLFKSIISFNTEKAEKGEKNFKGIIHPKNKNDIYSISQKWVHPSHFSKHFSIISQGAILHKLNLDTF